MENQALRVSVDRQQIKISHLGRRPGHVTQWYDFCLSEGEVKRFVDKLIETRDRLNIQNHERDINVKLD